MPVLLAMNGSSTFSPCLSNRPISLARKSARSEVLRSLNDICKLAVAGAVVAAGADVGAAPIVGAEAATVVGAEVVAGADVVGDDGAQAATAAAVVDKTVTRRNARRVTTQASTAWRPTISRMRDWTPFFAHSRSYSSSTRGSSSSYSIWLPPSLTDLSMS